MVRWEYKILHSSARKLTRSGLPDDLNAHFDELGDNGWELVRAEPILERCVFSGSYTSGFVFFFKRPRDKS